MFWNERCEIMEFEPWMFAAMESEGVMDTREGRINKVVKRIKESGISYVGDEEFIEICRECDINPDLFDNEDIKEIEKRANE